MSALRSRVFFALGASATPLTIEALQATPLVQGVSVIMQGPAKGHFKFDENDQPVPVYIDETTLQQVMACASTYTGGLRVNAGHYTGVLDAAGFLANYRIDGEKLRADMTLFESFEKFDHLLTLITTIPDTFGLSIDFSGPSDFREGKAFARCQEIYSADLVPVPAANEHGLFAAGDSQRRWVFSNAGKLASEFDTPENNNMTLEQLSAQVAAALTQFADANTQIDAASAQIAGAVAKVDGVVAKVAEIETKFSALDGKFTALGDVPAIGTSLAEVKVLAESLQADSGDLRTKLASRMGIEFAARAGANPAGGKKADGPGETRKAFEIPSSERNTAAIRSLLAAK